MACLHQRVVAFTKLRVINLVIVKQSLSEPDVGQRAIVKVINVDVVLVTDLRCRRRVLKPQTENRFICVLEGVVTCRLNL